MFSNRFNYIFTICTVLLILSSCDNSGSSVSTKIDHIKIIGDTNALMALDMLDSLDTSIRHLSENVIKKYDLARLRVQDKAYVTATSDIVAKQLVAYYENNGTNMEKQEAYFYAGSVYRDLHDTPRSLEFYFKASEVAEYGNPFDTLMLRNTYSNLHYLFYNVQDYPQAYEYAMKEYGISKNIGKIELTSLAHLGMSLMALDSIDRAKDIFAFVLDTIFSNPKFREDEEILCSLLFNFSFLKDSVHAAKCISLLEKLNIEEANDFRNYAYGEYYRMTGKRNSAISEFNKILQNKSDLLRMYDASKALFLIYNDGGDIVEANNLARLFVSLTDSIDLGKRQELAATVKNEFQYHRDQQHEQRLIHEKQQFKSWLIAAAIAIVIVLFVSIAVIFYRRNLYLNKLLSISNELNKQTASKDQLQASIAEREKELSESKKLLDKKENDLKSIRIQLNELNEELRKSNEDLKKKERLLTERMAQNQTFINLLHQSELEGKAEDVIYAIRQSSEGKKNMTAADWKQLYNAIDELYPTFKDLLLKELGTFTEQQMQVCYLMRIGLSKTQIQNMTNLSRVTIWRWVKKFDWIQTIGLYSEKSHNNKNQ